MRQKDIILLAMEDSLTSESYKKLEATLERVLTPYHCDKDDNTLIKAYIDDCKFSNKSSGTIELYESILKDLSAFSTIHLLDYDHNIIKEYLSWKSKTCSPVTVAHKLTVIRTFYDFLVNEEWIERNPCKKIPGIKIPKVQKRGITDKELAKILEVATDVRDIALINFLAATGCRVSEACNLLVGDIDFENNTAFIRQAKGKKDRIVSFNDVCKQSLQTYFDDVGPRSVEAPVFLRKNRNVKSSNKYENTALTREGISAIFIKIQKDSGVSNFHPHALRHYCITKLLANNMPIKMVSMQAGHASVATTLDIYDDVTLVDMQREYKKAMNN